MRYLVFALPDDAPATLMIVPADPRDGPVEHRLVAEGTAFESVLPLLACCDTQELHDLRLDLLPKIQRKVGVEERVRRQVEREAQRAEHETQVVTVQNVQREFDKAAAEEWVAEIAGDTGAGGGS